MRQPILLLMLLLCCSRVFGQYATNQNKVWVFGHYAGLDFASGSPVPITTAINTMEGCASVSDSLGHLLFFTDGQHVYNRNGAIMPNGSNASGFSTYSTTQTLIAPVIGTHSEYYVFSLESAATLLSGSSHLVYCIVDMKLSGGLGDVVLSSLHTPLADDVAEKITAVAGNHGNIWVLAHRRSSPSFLSFEINSSGILAPIVSSVGTLTDSNSYAAGVLKVSHNRQKIVSQSVRGGIGRTEIFSFDPGTGLISDCKVLQTGVNAYGAEFSPDNTKLYSQVSTITPPAYALLQYDLSLSTDSAIVASRDTIIFSSLGYPSFDLKLACDGKIYFSCIDTESTLSCIANPNGVGMTSGYISHAVTLASGTYATYAYVGLPNTFIVDTFTTSLSIDEQSLGNTFKIYPSPITNKFTVSSSLSGRRTICFYNMAGVLASSLKFETREQTVENRLLPGIYSAVIVEEGKVVYRKQILVLQ